MPFSPLRFLNECRRSGFHCREDVAGFSEEELDRQDIFSPLALFLIALTWLSQHAVCVCVFFFYCYFYLWTLLVQGSLLQGWNFCVDGQIKLHEKMNSCSHVTPHVPFCWLQVEEAATCQFNCVSQFWLIRPDTVALWAASQLEQKDTQSQIYSLATAMPMRQECVSPPPTLHVHFIHCVY